MVRLQDFQFKLHDKFVAFKKCGEPRSNVKLLAISSSRGLLFAGSPTQPELKGKSLSYTEDISYLRLFLHAVIILKDLANAKTTGQQPLARQVPLPSVPNYISCSADGNLLAINHTQNGTSLLSIYAVPSFMTPDVRPVYSIRLAPEDYVHAVQLLWNPVLPNSLAVVLSNGALGMYALKEGGNFEMHSLDKSQQVKCGCWSPKGKQIVLGFPSGKLQQFKPDLTPAKTLVCPANVHDGPFDTIAIQWLSTFQFAVIFLQHGEDCSPSLYILNAPKAAPASYINYYDICYSLNGPRNHQFLFNHVPQWNVLLVTSANGVEVGIMGTAETGDTPAWQQFTLLDEARIELPLSESTQEETFPLGFVYDTSSTHQLVINEQKLQTMPMVHVLGSDGALLSFDFLNLLPGAVSVCSPPPPVADTLGQFRALNTLLPASDDDQEEQEVQQPATTTETASPPLKTPAVGASSDFSFAFTPNTVTSTPAPAKDKPLSMFSFASPAAKSGSASQLTFGAAPAPEPLSFAAPTATAAKPTSGGFGFGAPSTTASAGSMFSLSKSSSGIVIPRPAAPEVTATSAAAAAASAAPSGGISKPLYTVPPTFTPLATKPVAPTAAPPAQPAAAADTLKLDDTEPIIRDMIALQIEGFNADIQKQKDRTKQLLSTIATPSSLKGYAKRLDDLQELNEQAKDVEFELDVQGLRQGLNEAYAIVAECRGKLEIYRKPDITRLMNSSSYDPAGRRMLARLQSYVAANEAQLVLAQQHIDLQWEQFQDVVRRKSKSRQHMPCLEGIYQRLTKLQNLASDQRIVQNKVKAKLKEHGLLQVALLDQQKSRTHTMEAVDSLTESILSMTLSQAVDSNASKLTQDKLNKIRSVVQAQKINIICPQRPDRVGLKSEVILETKRKVELIKKAEAKPTTANKYTQSAASALPAAPAPTPAPIPAAAAAPQLPKPMPSKPTVVDKPGIHTIAPNPSATAFAFSQSSPFAKTSTVTTTTSTLTAGEAAKPGSSLFGGLGSSFSFGGAPKTSLSFGGGGVTPAAASKPAAAAATEVAPVSKANIMPGFGKDQPPAPEPTKPKEPATAAAVTAAPEPAQTPKAETKSFDFGAFKGAGGAVGGGATSSSAFSFGGLGSSLGFGGSVAPKPNASPVAAVTSTNSTSASPFGMFAAKPTVSETSVVSSKPNPAPGASVAAPASTGSGVTSTSDPIGGLFSSVNICKPNTKETASDSSQKPASLFGGSSTGSFSFGDASKGLFASITPVSTGTEALTTKADPSTTTAALKTADPLAVPTTATVTSTAPPVASAAPASAPTAAAAASAASPAAAPSATTASATPVPGSTFSFSNAFSSLSAGSTSSPSSTASSSTTTITSNSSTSVFGGGFAAATTVTAGSPFQAASTAASIAPAAAPAAGTTSAPTGNIFGNVPKPEFSVFGAAAPATPAAAAPSLPPTGLFASAAISNPAPFGSPSSGAASSGGNIFGQALKPSGFAQAAPAAAAAAAGGGGSIFGGAGNSPFGSSSIFGGSNPQSPVSAPAPGAGTSIFGQSVFGQSSQAASPASGGNLFSNPVGSPQQPQPSAFGGGGGGGSIFGSSAPSTGPAASGGSIFGGGNTTGSGGFGSFSQSSQASGGFGFGQGGAAGSVAQSGFGSPQSPPQQPAAPGGFGAKPVFGGSPAFGAGPTFGGAPTFGSPKGFGGFGGGGANPVASPPAFGAAPKPTEGNIFETLGGQESGLSFGNLAQTGNSNAQKPAFGG
ncbi:hypothetical protein KR054_008222 [Drosophila jambulina]|nr:hypothetical protein KR054_008222 [Drosophila jambulina]